MIYSDGTVDYDNRGIPSRVRISLSRPGWPVLEQLACIYGRRLSPERSNGSKTVDWTNIPYNWKEEVPELGLWQRDYVRGLLDGDGSLTWCTTRGYRTAHVDFCYHPSKECVIGQFYRDLLHTSGWAYCDSKRDDVTVLMVGNWLHASELAEWAYSDSGDLAIPNKRDRAAAMALEGDISLVSGRKSWYLKSDGLRV